MDKPALTVHGLHKVEDQLRISLPDFLEKPFDVHGKGHVHGLMAEIRQSSAYRFSLNKGIGLIGIGSFYCDSIV
jgi:hypothetical protein